MGTSGKPTLFVIGPSKHVVQDWVHHWIDLLPDYELKAVYVGDDLRGRTLGNFDRWVWVGRPEERDRVALSLTRELGWLLKRSPLGLDHEIAVESLKDQQQPERCPERPVRRLGLSTWDVELVRAADIQVGWIVRPHGESWAKVTKVKVKPPTTPVDIGHVVDITLVRTRMQGKRPLRTSTYSYFDLFEVQVPVVP